MRRPAQQRHGHACASLNYRRCSGRWATKASQEQLLQFTVLATDRTTTDYYSLLPAAGASLNPATGLLLDPHRQQLGAYSITSPFTDAAA